MIVERRLEMFFAANPERRPVVNEKPLHWSSASGWRLKCDDHIHEDGRRSPVSEEFDDHRAMRLVAEKLLDALWEKTQ